MSDGLSLFDPRGFRASGVTAGLKASGSPDLAVLASDDRVRRRGLSRSTGSVPRPVKWCRERLPADDIRAVVINSGNANAATGASGTGKRPAHGRGARPRYWIAGPSRCWSHRRE